MILAVLVYAALSEAATVSIVVACISAATAIVVAAIQRMKNATNALRTENRADHNVNYKLLLSIDEKIDHVQERLEDRIVSVERKVDKHVAHHAYKGGKRRA